MFSSPISKRGMEFYLETAYWEDVLFTEISLIISHHFNVLSEGKKKWFSSFLLEVSHCESSPFPWDKPLCREARRLPVQPNLRERPSRRLRCVVRAVFSCPGHNTVSHHPLSINAVLPLWECFAKLQLFPFSGWLLSIIMEMLYQILIYRG